MSKVLLYSGGFDSTVLLHRLRESFPDEELFCIHFDYGQINRKQEYKCAEKNCKKLSATLVPISVPPFTWTTSNFYGSSFDSVESQELEFRNLIFLSYALSFAKSVGADEVYMATLKSAGYVDTSTEFFEGVNDLLDRVSNIHVVTPFSEMDKYNLANLAFYYDIKEEDFFSCDTPVKGKPCGKCPDCIAVHDIMESIKVVTPIQQFSRVLGDTEDKLFKNLFRCSPVTEARLYINNKCQLKCKHCYYGFDDMKSEQMTEEEFKHTIDECVANGITSFHFSGKEPLFDESIFKYAEYIKTTYPEVSYDVVTNGLRLKEFAVKLKECGFSRVSVSIDDISAGDYRTYEKSKVMEGVDAVTGEGVPVTMFIDLSENNYDRVGEIIRVLYEEHGIISFYVRAISPIGNAEDMKLLTARQLDIACEQLYGFACDNEGVNITFNLPNVYTSGIIEDTEGLIISEIVSDVLSYANGNVLYNFIVYPEAYCGRYENQITITPDGYVLGCASETSCADYDKISAGNVKTTPLKEIISKGKEIGICANCALKNKRFDHCTFID